ncbi:MAG TPA: glutaredoxin 3 [Allosphingosinicella sp.]|nr:glutaredoxin 3 [Allosphingosinicella sp.]
MVRIEIYTKFGCPYCYRAKRLLEEKGAPYEEYEINSMRGKREEMLERANGRTTVPQIFIGGRHVGGSDDLAELERTGRLDPMLEGEGAES